MTEDQKKTLAMLHPNFPAEPNLIVPRGKLPTQLLAEIQVSKDGKFLLAGQRGMGKTTELRRLFHLLREQGFLPLFVQFGAQETITCSISLKGPTRFQRKGPLRSAERSDEAILTVYTEPPWFFNPNFFSASFSR